MALIARAASQMAFSCYTTPIAVSPPCSQVMTPVLPPAPAPFAAGLCRDICQQPEHLDEAEGTTRKAESGTKRTFFNNAQVVSLALHDGFQALDVARQVLDLGLVELGGGFGVLLFPCWLRFSRWQVGEHEWVRERRETGCVPFRRRSLSRRRRARGRDRRAGL